MDTKDALVDYFSLVVQKARHDKGGPGSGNWGHAGRPGSRGGSVPASTARSLKTGKTAKKRQAAAKQGGAKKEGGKKDAGAKGGGKIAGAAVKGLPQDLTQMSAKQERKVIDTFKKMPLKELRRRQDIAHSQLKQAAREPDSSHKTRGIVNVSIVQDLLAAAVDEKVFGDE